MRTLFLYKHRCVEDMSIAHIYFNRSLFLFLILHSTVHISLVWLCVLVLLSPPMPPVCFANASYAVGMPLTGSVCVCRWNFSSLFICFHLHFDLTACHFILFLFSILKHRVPLGWPTKLTVHTRIWASKQVSKKRTNEMVKEEEEKSHQTSSRTSNNTSNDTN